MAEDGQEGPDLETLQAQIDMSMAFTQNIVSGWMKSSKTKLPSSSRSEDRELEEYMRRPPRLGVGASAPEATGVLSRESAKLRNKLAGRGKKREREDADEPGRSGGATAAATAAGSDKDEEEGSRARVITKKARVDPFAAKGEGKKKKKKNKGGPAAASPPQNNPVVSARPAATGSGEDAEMNEAGEGTGEAKFPESGAALPAPSKKKKKKKHKAGAPPDGSNSEQWGDTAATIHGKDLAGRDGPTGISVLSAPTPSAHPPSKPSAEAASGASHNKPSARHPAVHASATSPNVSPSACQAPSSIPLLNLSGPPPAVGEAHLNSPKKKRKRKKKKKKGIAHPATANDIDPMHADHGSDDD
ncbi:hypothetical protein C8Q79DRAFT_942683 [Trametes meyenii]|nr:hypothetical protein C8Q79DRAFT_942683 [Trametes meyenii]